ncbi:MAG: 7-cyano-7-deazaguanine synthase [bacterium]|nr:7-cyano-7-deazaguanine synthase [bacterium]
MAQAPQKICILTSGGIDSSLLMEKALEQGYEVHPYYLRFGMHWEKAELDSLKKLITHLETPDLKPLTVQSIPYQQWFPDHWGFHPEETPELEAPDPAVFIPGRNIFLIACATAFSHRAQLEKIWLGTLKGNSFQDGKSDFFKAFSEILGYSFSTTVPIEEPFIQLEKLKLIGKNPDFPYSLTLSCIKPQEGKHCGACQKCGERQRHFRSAGLKDPTEYATL